MHRNERRARTSKRSRETEAEAVAFVVCQAIGLETGSAAQDYIQLYEGDAKLLSESLEHISKLPLEFSTLSARGNPPRRPAAKGRGILVAAPRGIKEVPRPSELFRSTPSRTDAMCGNHFLQADLRISISICD